MGGDGGDSHSRGFGFSDGVGSVHFTSRHIGSRTLNDHAHSVLQEHVQRSYDSEADSAVKSA